jgi:MFS family permease
LARIVGGLVGWIVSVSPLILVNILGALGVLSWDDAFIASAVALLAGPLLGGLVAGYLAVRPERETRSGARAAGLAGGLVAALYFLSVLCLVVFALRPETIPATLQEHPLRSSLAVLALAIFALSAVGAAFFLGAWFDRHTYQVAYESYTAKMRAINAQKAPNASRPAAQASRPGGPAESQGSSLRDWRDHTQTHAQRGYGGYPSGPRREDDAAPRRQPWRSQ